MTGAWPGSANQRSSSRESALRWRRLKILQNQCGTPPRTIRISSSTNWSDPTVRTFGMVFLYAPYAKPDDRPSEWRVDHVPDRERLCTRAARARAFAGLAVAAGEIGL